MLKEASVPIETTTGSTTAPRKYKPRWCSQAPFREAFEYSQYIYVSSFVKDNVPKGRKTPPQNRSKNIHIYKEICVNSISYYILKLEWNKQIEFKRFKKKSRLLKGFSKLEGVVFDESTFLTAASRWQPLLLTRRGYLFTIQAYVPQAFVHLLKFAYFVFAGVPCTLYLYL